MGVRDIKAIECVCDGCGKRVLGTKAEPPNGLRGNVIETGDWGAKGADWFACQRKCVGKAVEGALSAGN